MADYDDDDIPDEAQPRSRKTPPSDKGPTDPRAAVDAAWQAREEMARDFNVRRLRDVKLDAAPEAWLDDLVYGGSITIVAGEANAGKGWFALAVGACVVTGRSFLTAAEPAPRCVLYINPERDPLGQRFRAGIARHPALDAALNEDRFLTWTPGKPFDRAMLGTFQQLVYVIKQQAPGFECENCLLILDPLRPLLSGNENDSAELAVFFTQLRQVTAPTGPLPGAAVLVVHHTGWQDTQLAVARERGSSDLRAAADVTLVLRNVRQLLDHQARRAAQQRGQAATLNSDDGPELLLLERHKNRVNRRSRVSSVLELEPQAVIEPDGSLGDSAWMVRSQLLPADVEAMFEAGKTADREATVDADSEKVLVALRAGEIGSHRNLLTAVKLSDARLRAAVHTLLTKGVLVRDRDRGPVRLA